MTLLIMPLLLIALLTLLSNDADTDFGSAQIHAKGSSMLFTDGDLVREVVALFCNEFSPSFFFAVLLSHRFTVDRTFSTWLYYCTYLTVQTLPAGLGLTLNTRSVSGVVQAGQREGSIVQYFADVEEVKLFAEG